MEKLDNYFLNGTIDYHTVHHLNTVKTQIIGRRAMSLELPPLGRSDVFFVFLSPKGAEQLCFCSLPLF